MWGLRETVVDGALHEEGLGHEWLSEDWKVSSSPSSLPWDSKLVSGVSVSNVEGRH